MRKLTLVFILSALFFLPLLQAQDKGGEARPFLATTKPFTGDRHVSRGLECSACHGDAEKKTAVGADKCLVCHNSFKEVAEKTKDLKPNPHQNHVVESGDVECTSCHHAHKANEIYCRSCHESMNFERPPAAK